MQPKKIMGATTRLNISPTWAWPMLQPSTRPPEAENSATSSATPTKVSGACRLNSTPGRSSAQPAGITVRPAASACSMPATTFSIATQEMSIGANKRSSISWVNWNSPIRGIATDQMPAPTMLRAMMPGSNRLLYSGGM